MLSKLRMRTIDDTACRIDEPCFFFGMCRSFEKGRILLVYCQCNDMFSFKDVRDVNLRQKPSLTLDRRLQIPRFHQEALKTLSSDHFSYENPYKLMNNL